jgi:crossover junction endodeoxyribonuclease RuvC
VIVLGIDPGLANTGFGVVARDGGRLVALDGGTIETAPGLATERRLALVAGRIREILLTHACDAMALEQIYFGQNVRTAFAVGHARGAAMVVAGEHDLPCFSYTPQQVKAAVCGSGRAAKRQVARMVQAQLSLDGRPSSDHAADALAVAICHINGAPLARALTAAGATA